MNKLKFLEEFNEKINNSKSILKKFWNYESLNSIPSIIVVPPYYNLDKGFICTPGDFFQDHEIALNVQLETIKVHLEKIDDLYIPSLNTYLGTVLLASAFGGKIRHFKDKEPWVESYIINDYKDIDKIKKPHPKKDGLTKTLFERIEYWKNKTNGKIPISLSDCQGPLSIAIDLMGASKLYMGLYDGPKRIHSLLEIISEFIIDYLDLIYPIIESEDGIYEWTGIYFPKGKGRARISEDNIISLSPDLFNEFLKPYNELILKETKGGLVHWCGNGNQNLDNILETKGLTGIHNSTMGDMNLIKKQLDRIRKFNHDNNRKVIYFNSLCLPTNVMFVNDLLKIEKGLKGIINQIFYSVDNFGISFDSKKEGQGYKKLVDNPKEILKAFSKTIS